ncbi:hypothetical protein [Gloeobacter violaceus]|uniref:hypothetical protein n=1 Tax=Gloeobacter violaceus TaxID=33072 RepID=UPI0002F2656A|nr:hypothetical protein [Gloeobacter violaceus]
MKTFCLLSIGQRGVGKTVFLAGSYAEWRQTQEARPAAWFDCDDQTSRRHLEQVLAYIGRTGHYPPATIKVTDFHFHLRVRHWSGQKTLCHFDWQDIPGELCEQPDGRLRAMVLNSHGCCVFLDALALYNRDDYADRLQTILEMVKSIALLAAEAGLPYAFAIVLTKCDLLAAGGGGRGRLIARLAPMTGWLAARRIDCRLFFVGMPLVREAQRVVLRPVGATETLVWLVGRIVDLHSPAGRTPWAAALRTWVRSLRGERPPPEPGILGRLAQRHPPPPSAGDGIEPSPPESAGGS